MNADLEKVLVLEAKRDSGKLPCPLTALMCFFVFVCLLVTWWRGIIVSHWLSLCIHLLNVFHPYFCFQMIT